MTNNIQTKISVPVVAVLLILSVLSGLVWTGTSDIGSRVITVRYFLMVLIGLQAFLTPYLFFPDKQMPLLQLANISGTSLNRYLVRKFLIYSFPVFIILPAMIFGDLYQPLGNLQDKLIYTFHSLFLYAGTGFIALYRYLKSGSESQFWQESEKGKNLRKKVADYMKYPMDPGAIPSLLNTVIIVSIGAGGIITSAYLADMFHPGFELAISVSLFCYSLLFMRKSLLAIDRNFYNTNAFFREFFGETMTGEEAGVKRKVNQLWWVPAYLRAHVWQFIVQTERIIPAGRLVAAGHAVLLFIAYQRPDQEFMIALWILFAMVHHLLILLTFRQDVSPYWLHRWLAEYKVWIISRFWMQVRWVLPLLAGMNVQYFLFGIPELTGQCYVILVYLVSGFFISLVGNNVFIKSVNE